MPAAAQFGADYSSNKLPAKPVSAAKATNNHEGQNPAPKATKSQKVASAMQRVGQNLAPWTPQLPEDDPDKVAAGYVPPQGKRSGIFRKSVRVMQGVVSLGQGSGQQQ
jgi:hypothetical protein